MTKRRATKPALEFPLEMLAKLKGIKFGPVRECVVAGMRFDETEPPARVTMHLQVKRKGGPPPSAKRTRIEEQITEAVEGMTDDEAAHALALIETIRQHRSRGA